MANGSIHRVVLVVLDRRHTVQLRVEGKRVQLQRGLNLPQDVVRDLDLRLRVRGLIIVQVPRVRLRRVKTIHEGLRTLSRTVGALRPDVYQGVFVLRAQERVRIIPILLSELVTSKIFLSPSYLIKLPRYPCL